MFNTLIRAIRQASYPTGFQAYLNSIQSSARGSGPTVEEARRDYREMSHQSQHILR